MYVTELSRYFGPVCSYAVDLPYIVTVQSVYIYRSIVGPVACWQWIISYAIDRYDSYSVYIDTRSNDKSLLYRPTRRSINLYFTIQCADYDTMIGLVCRACGRNWQTNNKKRKHTKVYAYLREPVSSVEVNSV